MGLKNRDVKSDEVISIALMAPFIVLSVQYFILIYFNLIDQNSAAFIQLGSKILVGLIFLYALPVVLKRSMLKSILIFLTAVLVFILNYVLFPVNQIYLNQIIFPLFFMCIPALIYTLSIRDWSVLKIIMVKAGYIVFLVGILISSGVFLGIASIGPYSMPFSYYMLLPAVMFMDELFNKFSLRSVLFVFISLVIILALGSRGAVLCIIIFILLRLICPGDKLNYRGVFSCLGISLLGLTGYLFMGNILQFLNTLFLKFGIQSRSIALFLSEGVYLSGRDKIYALITNKIMANPFWGLGLAGDRAVLEGTYAHNFLIEVVSNYGIIFGVLILAIILYFTVKSLATKSTDEYNMIIIWISLGFVHLMVSSSYLIDLKFWIFSGIVINSLNFRD